MPNWKTEVKFRDLLKEYNANADDESAEIQRVIPLWIKRFNSYQVLTPFIEPLRKVKTEAGFNKLLGKVYDYCDANRIWVEV